MGWPWQRKDRSRRKTDPHRVLFQASADGDVAAARALLAAGVVDVNRRDTRSFYEYTALHWAAARGHARVMDVLLAAGARPNAADKDRWTPLHWAARNGHHEAASLLLSAGADADAADRDGLTPLHNAAASGHDHLAGLLLQANAHPDGLGQHRQGRTPLHVACKENASDVARVLLVYGADLHATDLTGCTPLHICLHRDQSISPLTLRTLQALVSFGAIWDPTCEELVANGLACEEAPGLSICLLMWAQEHDDGLPFTDVPLETIQRGPHSTQVFIHALEASRQAESVRTICVVGPSRAGKTTLITSILSKKPHIDVVDEDRTSCSDSRRSVTRPGASRPKVYEASFSDFAGENTVGYPSRTLFLVCVDLEACSAAFLQSSIVSDPPRQDTQLLDEFIERMVLGGVVAILEREPDAEFVFLATKADVLEENETTGELLKQAVRAQLDRVQEVIDDSKTTLQSMSSARSFKLPVNSPARVVFVSCSSTISTAIASAQLDELLPPSEQATHQATNAYSHVLAGMAALQTVDRVGLASTANTHRTPAARA